MVVAICLSVCLWPEVSEYPPRRSLSSNLVPLLFFPPFVFLLLLVLGVKPGVEARDLARRRGGGGLRWRLCSMFFRAVVTFECELGFPKINFHGDAELSNFPTISLRDLLELRLVFFFF